MTVYSLCDHSHNALLPWAEAGFDCIAMDIRNSTPSHPLIRHVQCDINEVSSLPGASFVMAWPPCTDLARSGARHWKAKGDDRRDAALAFVLHCVSLAGDCRLIVENPVGRLSTMWRQPDGIVHPWWFSESDNYTKKTCLWTFNGARLPTRLFYNQADVDTKYIHHMPGIYRGSVGSVTPMGLARAIFRANEHMPVETPMPSGFDWT